MTSQRSNRPSGAPFWLLLGGLLAAAACAKKAEPEQVAQAVEKANPAPAERASEEEAEEESGGGAKTAAADIPPTIDPARIPVEEDFAKDAERQITKNSNLEAELARIAREIRANPAQAAETEAEKN